MRRKKKDKELSYGLKLLRFFGITALGIPLCGLISFFAVKYIRIDFIAEILMVAPIMLLAIWGMFGMAELFDAGPIALFRKPKHPADTEIPQENNTQNENAQNRK